MTTEREQREVSDDFDDFVRLEVARTLVARALGEDESSCWLALIRRIKALRHAVERANERLRTGATIEGERVAAPPAPEVLALAALNVILEHRDLQVTARPSGGHLLVHGSRTVVVHGDVKDLCWFLQGYLRAGVAEVVIGQIHSVLKEMERTKHG